MIIMVLAEEILTCIHNDFLGKKIVKISKKNILMKFSVLSDQKKICILHGPCFFRFERFLTCVALDIYQRENI